MDRRLLRGVTAALLLLAAACGDTDDDSATDAPTTTASGDAPVSSTVPLTGEPVRVGAILERVFDDPREESHLAAQAAVDELNANGGIGGRPVEIEFCDALQNDPNSATECARQFADDPGIVAILGMWSIVGEGANGVLEEAGLASIGNSPLAGADFQCSVCFPVSGGALASVAGQANLIDDLLGDRVGMAFADVPAGQQLAALVGIVFDSRGSTAELDAVPVPVNVADMASIVAATSDNDGIAMVIPPDNTQTFIRAARSTGVDVPVVVTTQVMTEPDLDELGAEAEGIYVVSSFDLDSPTAIEFDEAMDALDPDAPKTDSAKAIWLSVRLFGEVAAGLPEITRASVLAALPTLTAYETGMTPTIDFSTEFTGVGGALPRVFNTTVYYGVVEDGEVVPVDDGEPVPVFEAPEG